MKKYIASVLIPCLLLHFYGCSSTIYPPSDELEELNPDQEIVVVLKDNRTMSIIKWLIQNDTLYIVDRSEGEVLKKEAISALTDIKIITQTDYTVTIIVIGIVIGAAALVLILSTADPKGCLEPIKIPEIKIPDLPS